MISSFSSLSFSFFLSKISCDLFTLNVFKYRKKWINTSIIFSLSAHRIFCMEHESVVAAAPRSTLLPPNRPARSSCHWLLLPPLYLLFPHINKHVCTGDILLQHVTSLPPLFQATWLPLGPFSPVSPRKSVSILTSFSPLFNSMSNILMRWGQPLLSKACSVLWEGGRRWQK